MTKTVSIIIAVYNGEQYLKDAIDSALSQDYPYKEIIVVNDGSKDGTADIIASYGTALKHAAQPNKGLGAARNLGRKIAKGSFLSFLDHDDFWAINHLSTLINAFEQQSELDPLFFSKVQQFLCPSLSKTEQSKLLVNTDPMQGYIAGCMLLSTHRFDTIGPFLEDNQVGEFIDWFMRAKEKKIPILALDHVGLFRRVHLTNMGRQKNKYNRAHYAKILKASLDRRRASTYGE